MAQRSPKGAKFTSDRRHRYYLWRTWGGKPFVLYLLLNPSTADESDNDPTVERCERRARMMGFGGMVVLNIFALVSTDPKGLLSVPDPVGRRNDRYISFFATRAGQVVCGWGNHGRHLGRGRQVLQLLDDLGVTPFVFGVTKTSGCHPQHPLYVSYSRRPYPLTAEVVRSLLEGERNTAS